MNLFPFVILSVQFAVTMHVQIVRLELTSAQNAYLVITRLPAVAYAPSVQPTACSAKKLRNVPLV